MSAQQTNTMALQRILIAGSGLDAWMTAAELANALSGSGIEILVVGSDPEEAVPERADSTQAWPNASSPLLDLNAERFVAEINASFSMGRAFSGWPAQKQAFFLPFGDTGETLNNCSFFHLAHRLRQQGQVLKLANYSKSALAAQTERVDVVTQAGSQRNCGLMLETSRLGDLYRAIALPNGVLEVDGALQDVARDEAGWVDHWLTDAGEKLQADLYLNCSGHHGGCFGTATESHWTDLADRFPFDRVMCLWSATEHVPVPFEHYQAFEHGWLRHLPLPGGMSIRASYSSAQIEDDAVMQAIAGSSAFDQADLNVYTPGYGRTEQPWRGNLLVLGNAAARFDPIGVSQLQMLRADIHRLLELLPAQADAAPERQEFNRRASAYQASALDFATAIFELNGQRKKDTDLSNTLAYRLELFRASGRLAQYDEEAVDETAWQHLLDGCAIHPRTYAIQADQYPVNILLEHAEKVRQKIVAEVSALPTHQACLARLQSLRTQN